MKFDLKESINDEIKESNDGDDDDDDDPRMRRASIATIVWRDRDELITHASHTFFKPHVCMLCGWCIVCDKQTKHFQFLFVLLMMVDTTILQLQIFNCQLPYL